MGVVNAARVRARQEMDEQVALLGPDALAPGPWCPLNGHSFTCPCRECSEYWGTSAGTMVWQAWQDHARAVGDL